MWLTIVVYNYNNPHNTFLFCVDTRISCCSQPRVLSIATPAFVFLPLCFMPLVLYNLSASHSNGLCKAELFWFSKFSRAKIVAAFSRRWAPSYNKFRENKGSSRFFKRLQMRCFGSKPDRASQRRLVSKVDAKFRKFRTFSPVT